MRHRSPVGLAGVDAAKSFTYAELVRRAAGLASRRRAEGVVAGDVVAVALERSAGAVVAVLATLKAGAGYLPLDASQPEELLALSLAEARAGVALVSCSHSDLIHKLTWYPVGVDACSVTIEAHAKAAAESDANNTDQKTV